MTTFRANGIGQSVSDFNGQPGDTVIANGIRNFASVGQTPGVTVRIDGMHNRGQIENSDGATVFIHGAANNMLIGASFATVMVSGVDNRVTFNGFAADVAVDHGQRTVFGPFSNLLTIQDFEHDQTGLVLLGGFTTPAQAVAAETSDGHGGTLLTVPGVGDPDVSFVRIDFVGDPHVGISHFAPAL